jgi:hypothetical protein
LTLNLSKTCVVSASIIERPQSDGVTFEVPETRWDFLSAHMNKDDQFRDVLYFSELAFIKKWCSYQFYIDQRPNGRDCRPGY